MENPTKNVNTKQRQFEIMLNFMKEHPQLAKGYIKAPEAKQATNNLWSRLTEELNAAGPPMREVVGWKKVWADHKTHLKAKLRKNRNNFSGTGGGPAKLCSFTALEEGVIELLDMQKAVDGMSGVRKFGINNSTPQPAMTLVRPQAVRTPRKSSQICSTPS
ncbi:uncharacterized protein LOC142224011 [Haematobia irritans]|uniref:uncharacterized protein LOC142224011 n=1 Tax=Haematobia irritans TaxID=7368 RepID=UPI003F4FE027